MGMKACEFCNKLVWDGQVSLYGIALRLGLVWVKGQVAYVGILDCFAGF